MPLYENTFIVRQVASPNQVEELTAGFSNIVREHGGQVTKVEQWGLRNLAYKIQKNKKGHYVHLNINAPAAALAELERNQRINEEVLRFLTIKVDELESGPSAMMRKREEGDEGMRGGFGAGKPLRPRAETTGTEE